MGKQIRSIRKKENLSQEEVAFRSNMSTQYLSDVERGRRNISAIRLIRLAKALDVEVGELFHSVKIKK